MSPTDKQVISIAEMAARLGRACPEFSDADLDQIAADAYAAERVRRWPGGGGSRPIDAAGARVVLSVRVPADLVEQLDGARGEQTRAEAVIWALRAWLAGRD